MLPSLGDEGLAALRGDEDDARTVGASREDAADSGDGDAGDFPRNAG